MFELLQASHAFRLILLFNYNLIAVFLDWRQHMGCCVFQLLKTLFFSPLSWICCIEHFFLAAFSVFSAPLCFPSPSVENAALVQRFLIASGYKSCLCHQLLVLYPFSALFDANFWWVEWMFWLEIHSKCMLKKHWLAVICLWFVCAEVELCFYWWWWWSCWCRATC